VPLFRLPCLRGGVIALLAGLPLPALAQQPAPPLPPPAPAVSPVTQIQSAPRAPVPNRFNDVLPAWLRVRGEFRERLEGFDGLGFASSRDDYYWLSRLRLNAALTPSKSLSFQLQAQDARVGRKTVGPTGVPFRAPLDLRMAFADVGAASARVSARLGRQELAYGEQRLVGHVGWLNAARAFDAVKVTFRAKTFSVDAFGASVVRTLVDGFDRSGNGNRFAGLYATTTRLIPQATVEPYLFWKRDVNLRGELGRVADLQHSTIGVRLAGTMPWRLDYGTEMALQRGAAGSENVRAWAGHWQLRESLPGPAAIRLTGEYNFASGDEDPADGVRGTFDQLYPTPHDKTGLSDQIGWKNIHHARAGVEFTPLKGWPVATNYHSWWLAETRDAVYNVGNTVVARLATGAVGAHVGQEIDLQVARALRPHLALAAGYAHIVPGVFLKAATPGASYSHPYVMVTYVFLAER
jgi:hypothetical protein